MKKVYILTCILVFTFFLTYQVFAGNDPPVEGGMLPQITLMVPENPDHQKYLGVTGKSIFIIPGIKADVVIVEIFSMYCPHCQKDAPVVNELYRKIENNKNLKEKVKLIGVGAGNSEYEVGFFKKKYGIKFPLFPDSEFSIHKILGEVRTPFFIGLKIKDDGTHRIFYSRLGSVKDADKFLKLIIRLSGLK